MKEKTTKSPLTKAQIKKFKKLQDEAEDNSEKTGYYVDEFDYCLGRFAEDLCSAGYKEWAKKIYKKAEEKAKDNSEFEELAESIRENLGDKEWAKKIQES